MPRSPEWLVSHDGKLEVAATSNAGAKRSGEAGSVKQSSQTGLKLQIIFPDGRAFNQNHHVKTGFDFIKI